jgi:hypothetical protein
MNHKQYLAERDSEAFHRHVGICYRDEQGRGYEFADFYTACNDDATMAAQLFALSYWAPPRLHFLLDEELPIARLTRHKDLPRYWLQFKMAPGPIHVEILTRNGWVTFDDTQRVWESEQAEWAGVPSGIAYHNYGARECSPLEGAAQEARNLEIIRERSASGPALTPAAQDRHEEFLRDYRAATDRFFQGPSYVLRQLPANAETLLPSLEQDVSLHLRIGSATDPEGLYRELERQAAHCTILISEYLEGKVVYQVKVTRERGSLVHLRRRELEGDLLPLLILLAERLNAVPARERLRRAWKEDEAFRENRIEDEAHLIEWGLLMRRMDHRDHQENRIEETTRAAETVLRLIGWRSAYAFALGIAPALSDAVTIPEAQAFLAVLSEQHEAARVAQSQATLESLSSIVETGRVQGFYMLMKDVTQFLLPLELQPDENPAQLF